MSVYEDWVISGSRDATGRGPLDGATHSAELDNPFCGDRVTVHLRVVDDHIVEATYEARACAICMASAGRVVALLCGQSTEELAPLAERAAVAVKGGPCEPELAHLHDLQRAPTRTRCATLPFEAAVAAVTNAHT